MSEFNTETITDRAGTGKPDLTFGFKINGSDSGINPFLHTESANEPSSPNNGDAWFDTDNNIYKVYINNEWKEWFGETVTIPWGGARALTFMQGSTTGKRIDYFAIDTAGNASAFGLTLGVDIDGGAACSDGTYAVFGGHTSSSSFDDIQYVTTATTGNAQYGMVYDPFDNMAAASDGTSAFYFGGYKTNPWSNKIQKFTIATFSGTASDFGDLIEGLTQPCGLSTAARTISAGGSAYANLYRNTIQYWNPASAGNASDFGDLNFSTHAIGAVNDLTRGVIGGGYTGSGYINSLDYITIANAGNATDFGDLNYARSGTKSGGTDGTYGVFAGGYNGSARDDGINRITIQTAGNSTDFGNLTETGSTTSTTAGSAS